MTALPRPSRRSVLARRGLAGGVVALLFASASACGGDTTDARSASDDAVAASPAATPATEDPATQGAAAGRPAAGDQVDPADFVALFKDSLAKASTAHVTIETAGGLTGGLTGEGDTDLGTTPQSVAMTMTLPELGGDVEMRLVDGVAYLLLPQLGGTYVSFDLADPDNPLGSVFADQLDLAGQFDAFGDAIQDVTYVGVESVEGEDLDHYELTVDGTAVAEQAGVKAEAAGLPATITYDVYFDADGFFRQMSFDLGEQVGTTTLTYSDWGKDVSITAPKKSQVTSFPGTTAAG